MAVTQLIRTPNINGDQGAFNDDATYLFGTQLPTMINEINNDIALLNNNSTTGTSTTSIAVGTGSITLTASTGKSWVINSSVRIYSTASAGIWQDGYVTAYNSGTGSLTVMRTNKSGAGTLASWGIMLVPSVVGSDISLSGTGGRITGDFNNGTFANRVLFQSSIAGASLVGVIPNDVAGTAGYNFTNSNNTTNYSAGSIIINATEVSVNSTRVGTGSFLPLVFTTNNLSRFRIEVDGKSTFRAIDGGSSGSWITLNKQDNTAGFSNYLSAGATPSYTLINSGGVGVQLAWGATSWTTVSDEKKKDIIEPISSGLNKVNSLRALIGKYKKDEVGIRRSFLIAQDVQKVLPEAVDVLEDGTLGLKYTEVIPLLVAAIKELSAKVEALENV